MSNRSAKLEKDVDWLWGQVGKRNRLLNTCFQCLGDNLSELESKAGLSWDGG